MEKAVLLIEQTGAHLRCLLNPESLTFQRRTGVQSRQSLGGSVAGKGLSDDPLIYQGGGRTEFNLDLLVDLSLVPAAPDTPPPEDVRELTAPLWGLAENADTSEQYGRPPTVSFLWGTHWNVRAVVAAVSERLEHFSRTGNPARSWLRLHLIRVADEPSAPATDPKAPPLEPAEARQRLARAGTVGRSSVGDGQSGERLDQIAAERFGHPGYWPLLADINGVEDPLNHHGSTLQVPADPDLLGGSYT